MPEEIKTDRHLYNEVCINGVWYPAGRDVPMTDEEAIKYAAALTPPVFEAPEPEPTPEVVEEIPAPSRRGRKSEPTPEPEVTVNESSKTPTTPESPEE